ncbi:hypothetical protein P9281_01900 [Caballeronia sp. LP003]|uniref:hypothetical protein n=1 Tax=Caballeronia sp. LP003 TaxID=3038551 RepID=UPI0028556150|nr:hypothetical protein [Caballeronia sp. LP003]MDR5785310.1 hypothetical protein [Caballeronia sp. LP003]
MSTRSSSQLNFVVAPSHAATLEIASGSLSDADRIMTMRSVLSRYAAFDANARASMYLQRVVSVGFGELTLADQIFVADVAAAPGLLAVLLESFESCDACVRFAGELATDGAQCAIHLEDAHVWMNEDDDRWYASNLIDSDEAWPASASDDIDEIGAVCEVMPEQATGRARSPSRYRAARGDASVGSIRRRIEAVFGLPEGSVDLCGPDGRALRADARIATLRRRWSV